MSWRARVGRALGLPDPQRVAALEADMQALSVRLAAAREKVRQVDSGADIVNGQFRYEVAQELRTPARWNVLAKMESDAHVKGAVLGVALPLIGATWEVQPASEDRRDVEIAHFCAANLLRDVNDDYGRDYWCQSSWKAQRLPEILNMLWHGFALFAKSWREVNGKLVYDRIQWLEPSSVDPQGWMIDKGDIFRGVKRTYRDPRGGLKLQEEILAEDLMLYVWDMRGARYEGTPFVRAMYGPWFRKDFVLKQALIWAQKIGAPAPFGTYPVDYSPTDRANFESFVAMLRGTSPTHAYFAGPAGADGVKPEIGFAGAAAGEVDRMRGLIDGENAEIAHAGFSKSQLLGETATGSRSVGSTQQDREQMTIQAVAEIIAEWETNGVGTLPGVIEELVERNFAGVQAMPRLVVSRIQIDEEWQHFEQMIAAAREGLVPKHPEVIRQVTARFGLSLPDEVFDAIEWPPKPVVPFGAQEPPGGANEPEDDGDTEDEDEPEDAQEAREARAAALQLSLHDMLRRPVSAEPSSTYRRQPTEFEATFVVVASVSASLTDGESRVFGILRRATKAFVADIIARGRAGKITEETAANLRRAKPKQDADLKSALRAAFVSTSYDGKQHAEEELVRQRALQLEAVPPAGAVPKGKTLVPPNLRGEDVFQVLVTQLAEESRLAAEISINGIWDRMVSEAIGEWQRLRRAGVEGDQLWAQVEAFLDELSDGPVRKVARHVSTVAYNEGRDMFAKEALVAGLADWAVRSELLDNATCEECAKLDGTLVRIGSAEYEALKPPARCLGGENCRGFYVVMTRQQADALNEGDN